MPDKPPDSQPDKTEEFRVGPDCVILQGDIVHIFAWREIPDWTVREFCRPPIFFRGQKYFLRFREKTDPPYAIHYELEPWPSSLHEHSSRSYTYDRYFVAGRDRRARNDWGAGIARGLLLPFYPVLGFLWSGVKRRLLQPLGFAPTALTSASTFLELLVVILQGTFLGWLGGGIFSQLQAMDQVFAHGSSIPMVLDAGLLLLAAVDGAVRYSKVLHGDETPDGFLEWVAELLVNRKR